MELRDWWNSLSVQGEVLSLQGTETRSAEPLEPAARRSWVATGPFTLIRYS
jgi:hypothetical protein